MGEKLAYKVLGDGGSAFHGGTGRWPRPRGGAKGAWMPAIEGDLEACRRGYHLCRAGDLVEWLGPELWIAEWRGRAVECSGKVLVAEARLVKRVRAWDEAAARRFARDCARRALAVDERANPDDGRARRAIEGAGGDVEADAGAAVDAAWTAARAAAKAGAWPVAWAAIAAAASGSEPRTAARTAAWAVAGEVAAARGMDAGAAAWAEERAWQTRRLLEALGPEGRLGRDGGGGAAPQRSPARKAV